MTSLEHVSDEGYLLIPPTFALVLQRGLNCSVEGLKQGMETSKKGQIVEGSF